MCLGRYEPPNSVSVLVCGCDSARVIPPRNLLTAMHHVGPRAAFEIESPPSSHPNLGPP